MSEQLTTINILSLFETTKEQRQSFVMDLISRLESGEDDPLKVHLQIKAMEEIVKSVTSNLDYRGILLFNAEKYGKKFQLHNADFAVKETGTVYDWSKCEDVELNDLLTQKADLEQKIKAKQEFLKTVPIKGLVVTNEETGETTTIYPPAKSSTTSVTVTLK